jgi:hypothetical protein
MRRGSAIFFAGLRTTGCWVFFIGLSSVLCEFQEHHPRGCGG